MRGGRGHTVNEKNQLIPQPEFQAQELGAVPGRAPVQRGGKDRIAPEAVERRKVIGLLVVPVDIKRPPLQIARGLHASRPELLRWVPLPLGDVDGQFRFEEQPDLDWLLSSHDTERLPDVGLGAEQGWPRERVPRRRDPPEP